MENIHKLNDEYILEVSWGCPSEKYPANGVFQFDQAKALKAIGEKVVFLALDIRSLRRWRKWGVNTFFREGIPVFESSIPCGILPPQIKYNIQDISFRLAIRKIVNKYGNPKIVHVHNAQQAIAVYSYCKKNNVPYVITEHSRERYQCKSVEERKTKTILDAKAVIAVGSGLAKELKEKYKISPKVIGNIVDTKLFNYSPCLHDDIVYIAAGNMVKGKGFDVVIKAFARFLNEHITGSKKAKLIIMGGGEEYNNIIKLAENFGIQENVSFTGLFNRKEFAKMLNVSDYFLLPSRSETFGMVYIEAMAAGLPVIATKCGGPEDFINDDNGLLINIDDVVGLTDAMCYLYENGDRYERKKISADIKEEYSQYHIAKKIVNELIM